MSSLTLAGSGNDNASRYYRYTMYTVKNKWYSEPHLRVDQVSYSLQAISTNIVLSWHF